MKHKVPLPTLRLLSALTTWRKLDSRSLLPRRNKRCDSIAGLAGALLLIATSMGQPTLSSARPVGMEALAHPEYLPMLYATGTQTLQFSSYDITSANNQGPAGGNNDGEFGTAFVKYVDKNGEFVIFDSYGPGTLYRQQINIWHKLGVAPAPEAGASRVRYYFDDEEKPRIDLTVDEFFGGKHAPFDAPFSFAGSWADYGLPETWKERRRETKPFAVQYYPLSFQRRLKVTFVPVADFDRSTRTWYQFTSLQYPVGTPVTSWSRESPAGEKVREMLAHAGNDPKLPESAESRHFEVTVEPTATKALLDIKEQATIGSLKLHLAPYSEDTFFNVRVRVTWEGSSGMSFELPIGVFFGGGSGTFADRSHIPLKQLNTLFYGFDGKLGTFYSYWPMPFWSSAKIEIINNSAVPITLAADIGIIPKERLNYPAIGTGYFYAKQTKHTDSGDELFAPMFREHGFGHIVGTNLYTQDFHPDGDTLTYFDGSRTPQIHGSGTEDDLNQGWTGTDYQQALWGGLVSGIHGAYRIYLGDAFIFRDQVKINSEYSRMSAGSVFSAKTEYTVYYYKSVHASRERLSLTDSVDIGIAASEMAHKYTITGQTWEGSMRSAHDGYERDIENGSYLEEGRAFNGRSTFAVAVDPKNEGVRLRRLLSRVGNGVQTAEVWVDGSKVERPWHVVFNSSASESQGWVHSDFELPASLTSGKSTLRIEIRHLSSTKGELNEFHYWVFSHLPPRTVFE